MNLILKKNNAPGSNKILVLIGLLAVVLSNASAMQIFVSVAPDGMLSLDVEPSDNIENIKAKVQDQVGISPADQYLYASGTILEDGNTLADYNIQKEAVLEAHLIGTLGVASFNSFPVGLDMPIRSATSGPGSGWMVLSYSVPVDFSAIAPGGHQISLYGYNGPAPGAIAAFDPGQSYALEFLNSSGSVSGFSPGLFTVDTTHLPNSFSGTFSVVQNAPGSLAIAYSAVPEPATALLGAVGMAALWLRRRRHIRQ